MFFPCQVTLTCEKFVPLAVSFIDRKQVVSCQLFTASPAANDRYPSYCITPGCEFSFLSQSLTYILHNWRLMQSKIHLKFYRLILYIDFYFIILPDSNRTCQFIWVALQSKINRFTEVTLIETSVFIQIDNAQSAWKCKL